MSDLELTPTGRELKEPAATLVECVDPKGLKHTVIAYDPPFVGHEALTTGIELIASFLAYPMVTGLVECSQLDTARGRFAYPTGTIWTLKEVLRGSEQAGKTLGARAAIELCYLGAMILDEAGQTGSIQGCFSHGNLSPWRVGLKADGQLQVFGHGLAQVEMIEFLTGRAAHVDLDSIRYAPPERLERQPEQPSSDTYSLAVLAYELVTGRTLFPEKDGAKLAEAVKMAEGSSRVSADSSIPKPVREALASALIYDPDTRLQGDPLVDTMGELLDDPRIDGRTLAEVMQRMQQTARAGRKLVQATATAAFTAKDLAALAAADDDDDDLELEEPESAARSGAPRWGAVERTTGRGRRRPDAERPATRPAPAAPARARAEADEEGPRRRRRREPEAAPVAEEPRRRRRRPGDEDEELTLPPPEPTEAVESAEEDDDLPRRRRRRRPAEDAPSTDSTPADTGSPADTASPADAAAPAPVAEPTTGPVAEPAPAAEPVAEPPSGPDAEPPSGPDAEPAASAEDPRAHAEPVPGAEAAPPLTPSAEPEPAEDTPRRRRRRAPEGESPPSTVDPATHTAVGGPGGSADPGEEAAEDPAAPLRRRRRRLE